MTDEEFNSVDSFFNDVQPGIINSITAQTKTDIICESIWMQVQHLKATLPKE